MSIPSNNVSFTLTDLNQAIMRNRLDQIETILKEDSILKRINELDPAGKTPLHYAAEYDKTGSITRRLLEKGSDPNSHSTDNQTPIMLSILERNTIAAKALLETVLETDLELNKLVQIKKKDGNENFYNLLDIVISSNMKEIADLLRKKFDKQILLTDQWLQLYLDTALVKKIGHIQGLGTQSKGTKTVNVNYFSGLSTDIPVEGNLTYLSLKIINENLSQYFSDETITSRRTIEDTTRQQKILKAYEVASNFLEGKGESESSLIKRHSKGEIVLLPTTIFVDNDKDQERHTIGLSFYGRYMIYCNRGGGKRQEIKIYELTDDELSKVMTEDFLNKIYSPHETIHDSELNKFLSDNIASFKKPPEGHKYALERKAQRYGNCSYVNVNTLVEAVDFLLRMEENPFDPARKVSSEEKKEREENAKKCLEQSNIEYQKRTAYTRDKNVDKIVKELDETRTKGEENEHKHGILLKLTSYIIREHHGRDSKQKRNPEKVEGEISRMARLLKALTKSERESLMVGIPIAQIREICDIVFSHKKSDDHLDLVDSFLELLHSPNVSFKSVILRIAIQNADPTIIEKLLELPINIEKLMANSPFNIAIEGGKLESIKAWIEAGANVNAVDLSGFTPLMTALNSNSDSKEIIELLLNQKEINVNTVGPNKRTALWYANDSVTVDKLLSKGADWRIEDVGTEALTRAVRNDNFELVQKWIELGVNLNPKPKSGTLTDSALAYMARNGHVDLVENLLKRGADVAIEQSPGATILWDVLLAEIDDIKKTEEIKLLLRAHNIASIINIPDDNGESPLIFAFKMGNFDVVKLLIEAGASPGRSFTVQDLSDAILKNCLELVEMILKDHAIDVGELRNNPKIQELMDMIVPNLVRPDFQELFKTLFPLLDVEGAYSIMNTAIKNSNFTVIKLLKAIPIDINTFVVLGQSLLTLAIRENNFEMIKYLLDQGAIVNAQCLSYAADSTVFDTLLNSLKRQDDVNIKDIAREAILFAAERGNVEVVKRLLELGADPNPKSLGDVQGTTPLMYMASTGAVESVKLLLEKGAEVTVKLQNGETVLSKIIRANMDKNKQEALVRMLLQDKKIKDIIDLPSGDFLETPLMIAAAAGLTEIFKLLLKASADPLLISDGITARDVASPDILTIWDETLKEVEEDKLKQTIDRKGELESGTEALGIMYSYNKRRESIPSSSLPSSDENTPTKPKPSK